MISSSKAVCHHDLKIRYFLINQVMPIRPIHGILEIKNPETNDKIICKERSGSNFFKLIFATKFYLI